MTNQKPQRYLATYQDSKLVNCKLPALFALPLLSLTKVRNTLLRQERKMSDQAINVIAGMDNSNNQTNTVARCSGGSQTKSKKGDQQ
ncbi:MAG: hypothetical protein R6U28_00090 [Cyclonatronaceae bacterium]